MYNSTDDVNDAYYLDLDRQGALMKKTVLHLSPLSVVLQCYIQI